MSVVEREREVTREVTKADIFERAADLLEEFGWCQEASAVNDAGCAVAMESNKAVAFCMGGAYYRARADLGLNVDFEAAWLDANPDIHEPAKALGATCAQEFNDAPDRTKAEVVSALRSAAERALA